MPAENDKQTAETYEIIKPELFTEGQRAVLLLMINGVTRLKDIASALGIDHDTVKVYLYTQKKEAQSKSELGIFGIVGKETGRDIPDGKTLLLTLRDSEIVGKTLHRAGDRD